MAMPQRKLHITNSQNRNATVIFTSVKPNAGPKLGLPGREIKFRRYLASTTEGLHASLCEGDEDYAEQLIDGDPEIDIEQVGRRIGDTSVVYLAGDGHVLHAPPKFVEVIFDPNGEERDRRDPEDVEANVNEELPIRWTGRKFKKIDAVRRFVFGRTVQVRHMDGLTYDYLHGIAKELAEEDVMVRMGSGPKGRAPLVFQTNGSRYQAFLEGRVDGAKYQLLLHLSNMELRVPGKDEE